MTAKLSPVELVTALPPVSPAELQAAALTFARALREHIAEGFAQGQLETVLSGARCLEHLAGLAGPTVAAAAWASACLPRKAQGPRPPW
jgi:hypothetical protein